MKSVIKTMVIPASALALMLALSACGTGVSAPGDSGNGGATPVPSAPPITENPVFPERPSAADLPQGPNVIALRANIAASSDAEPEEVVLVCENGVPQTISNAPDATNLCASMPEAWEPLLTGAATVDANVSCTMQYGGPSVAVVVGTFNGQSVDEQFSRGDGCEIAKWNDMEPLLGKGASPTQ